MKKILVFLLVLFNVFVISAHMSKVKAEEVVLRVYNWQDYIDDGLDDDGNSISASPPLMLRPAP